MLLKDICLWFRAGLRGLYQSLLDFYLAKSHCTFSSNRCRADRRLGFQQLEEKTVMAAGLTVGLVALEEQAASSSETLFPSATVSGADAAVTDELPEAVGSFSIERLAPSQREIAENYLDDLLQIIESRSEDGHIATDGWTFHYPAMLAMNELSAYLVSGDQQFLDLATAQLDFSLTLENSEGLFVSLANEPEKSWVGRDSLARHILSLYVGYRITGNEKYLHHAETNVTKAIEKLARFSSPATNGYEIFFSQYDPNTYESWHEQSFLNQNQDSALGAAFLLLTHEPQSVLFQNQEIADLARSQIESSMSTQLATGEIPVVGTHDPALPSTCYDTGYGAYTLWSWAIAQNFEQNPVYEEHLQAGAEWLAQFSQPAETFERRCFAVPHLNPSPEEYTTKPIVLEGYLDRFLVFVESGNIPDGYEDTYFDLMADSSTLRHDKLGKQFSLAMAAVLGYGWSDFHIGADLVTETNTRSVKTIVRGDGTVFSLDSEGWLSVEGIPLWFGTQDFALSEEGILLWHGTGGQLQQRLLNGDWQNLAKQVTHFEVQSDGHAYSLSTDGWLRIDSHPVWSDTQDFSLLNDGTLLWQSTSGQLQKRLPNGVWQQIATEVTRFESLEGGAIYSLSSDGWLSVDGRQTWAGTQSFSLRDDGTLHWLGLKGQLQRRHPDNSWQNLDVGVVEFAVRSDGLSLALTEGGDVTVNGTLVWSKALDLRIEISDSLLVEQADGDVFSFMGRYELFG